MRDLQTNI